MTAAKNLGESTKDSDFEDDRQPEIAMRPLKMEVLISPKDC